MSKMGGDLSPKNDKKLAFFKAGMLKEKCPLGESHFCLRQNRKIFNFACLFTRSPSFPLVRRLGVRSCLVWAQKKERQSVLIT